MRVRPTRFFCVVLAFVLSVFSLGCLPGLFGNRQIERDMARTMMDIERIYQINAETQKRLDSGLGAMRTKSQADTELVLARLAEIEQRINALQETLGILRSQIEEIRFRTAGEGPDRVTVRVGEGDSASTMVLEGGAILLEGQNSLTRENYAQARASFLEFLDRFPASPRAAEAQMRIADSYYRERNWAQARANYEVVEKRYLTNPRVPEALMRMALCEEQLGREKEAIAILERLVESYPKWEYLQRARDQLQRLIKVEPILPPGQ